MSLVAARDRAAIGRPWRRWLAGLRWNAPLALGIAIVAVSIATAIFVPLLFGEQGARINFAHMLRPPLTGGHPMGTDQLGRDVFVRIAAGLRESFMISLSAVAVALVVGLTVGVLAGYFGGWVDTLLMRLTDVQMALPFIVLAVAILSVAQPGYLSLTIVLSLAAWPTYARVVRSMTRVECGADHLQAVLALGAGPGRIITRYLLRSVIGSALILSVLDVAAMIIYEATLGFLAIGVPPGTPSLGSVMADGKNYIASAWWITAMPGLFILFTLVGLNLIGIALRRAADAGKQR